MDGVKTLFYEGGVVQTAQAVTWALSVVVVFTTAHRRPTSLDRRAALWQGMLAVVALIRELDLHESLQTMTPIHFRLRWLLESDASFWWKGVVLAVGVAIAMALAPRGLVGPWWTLLRRGDLAAWLLLTSVACLFAGYCLDDIVTRRVRAYRVPLQIAEEALELVGAVAFWLFVEYERAWPLSTRLPLEPPGSTPGPSA
jgi:hypothetical protein